METRWLGKRTSNAAMDSSSRPSVGQQQSRLRAPQQSSSTAQRQRQRQQQDFIDYDYIRSRIAEVQRAAGAGHVDSTMPSTDNDASSVQGAPSAGGLLASSNRIHATTIRDPSLALLLPLLILLSTLLFLLVFFLVFLIVVRKRRGRGIALQDHEGPLDLSREEEFEGEGGVAGVEERWLEQQDEAVQRGYERAKREWPPFTFYYRNCQYILI